MDIAVADESPLGRYLADLDGTTGAGSLADMLQNEQLQRSASSATAGNKERVTGSTAAVASAPRKCRCCTSAVYWLRVMRVHAERFVAHWLVGSLTLLDEDTLRCDAKVLGNDNSTQYHQIISRVCLRLATYREELEELATCEQRVRRSWFLSGSSSSGATSTDLKSPMLPVAVAVSAVVYVATYSSSSAAASCRRAALYAAALVVVGVLTAELVYQLMLLFHWRKARQVVAAVRGYATVKEAFETSYQQSLDLVKKAELASRGYRIGAMLPPVGRIEKVTSMKCTQLRRELRQINDDMENVSRKLKKRESLVGSLTISAASGDQKGGKRRLLRDVEQGDVDSQRAPSLLISALTKRHELANVLLDGALHAALFDVVTIYWDLPCDEEDGTKEDSQRNVNRPRERQVVTFESLISQYQELAEMLSEWKRELGQMNNSRSMKFFHSMDMKSYNKTGGGVKSGQESNPTTDEKTEGVEVMGERLKELRTICETLKHLVFAAQHDVASAAQSPSSLQLSQSLAGTRGLMKSTVQSLNDAWDQYEMALDALGGAEMPRISGNSEDLEGEEITAGDRHASAAEVRQRESEEARLCEDQERKKFTFVFTGTSTGEKDFDLKAILKEQQQQQQKALPVPTFVRELQDVLAHRETHAQPIITKQIDHDKPRAVAVTEAPPELDDAESRSSKVDKPAPTTGGVLQSELQSLLLLQRVRAASEEFFG